MSILRNYNDNGIPEGNRFKYPTGVGPLIGRNRVPKDSDSKGPITNPIIKRVEDVARLTKLLIKPGGLKYIANETLLAKERYTPTQKKKQRTDKDGNLTYERTGIGKEISKGIQALAEVPKIIGSNLAQTGVSGTGIHYVKGFGKNNDFTYLSKLGMSDVPHETISQGGDFFFNLQTIQNTLSGSYQGFTTTTTDNANQGVQTFTGAFEEPFPNIAGREITSEDDVRNSSFYQTNPSGSILRVNLGNPTAGSSELKRDGLNFLEPQHQTLTADQKYNLGIGEGRDFAKFRFEIITPKADGNTNSTVLFFRAFIESFDDSFAGSWNSHQYVGRGENFYTYQGFDRNINVSFKVAAQSGQEMRPLYQKINYLAGATTPTYDDTFMRGTLVKMTVGDYVYELPGFLESVNLSWQKDYPWEIAMNRPEGNTRDSDMQELPMVLDVSIAFRPIHRFLPQAGGTRAEGSNKEIASRYITNGVNIAGEEKDNIFISQNE